MATDAKPKSSPLRERLEAVAKEYYNPLRMFFRKRTQNAPEVDDLVQQVFMRISRQLEKGTVQNPDAYIFRTASNTLKDFRRRELVRERVITGRLDQITEADEVESDFSPERVLISKEAMDIVVGALRRLPARTRHIFVLRCFEGLKYMDIAQLQNMSARSVERYVAQALKVVTQELDKRHERP